jgi:hypothetical protein
MIVTLRLVLAALVLLLAACGPGRGPRPTDTGLAGYDPRGVELQRLACERRGGSLGPGPGTGSFLCVMPARDSGKTCARSTDCDGECLSRSRTCAPVTPLRGCHDVLDRAGRTTRLCLN